MEQLTTAHEIYDPGETEKPLENTMDLYNNQIGRNIGSQSSFMLMMKIKFAVNNGELRYLSNTTPRATINSQLIPTNQ